MGHPTEHRQTNFQLVVKLPIGSAHRKSKTKKGELYHLPKLLNKKNAKVQFSPGQRNTLYGVLDMSSFFSLSARGPTCRCNSTGLAELWGGWRIELGTTNMLE